MGRTYSVAEAKARLSEILRTVKRGRSVTISDRGKPVARVVPLPPGDDLDRRVADLVERGVLTPPQGPIGALRPVTRRPGALSRFLTDRD